MQKSLLAILGGFSFFTEYKFATFGNKLKSINKNK